ncbi:Ferredoxin II, partial [Dysosmobacter welbionis]
PEGHTKWRNCHGEAGGRGVYPGGRDLGLAAVGGGAQAGVGHAGGPDRPAGPHGGGDPAPPDQPAPAAGVP